MTNNELLLAISNMLDSKLDLRIKPIEKRLDSLESRFDSLEGRFDILEHRFSILETEVRGISLTLENNICPRLNTIEACYTDTYNRYREYTERMNASFADTELLKKVVEEHSVKLHKLA